MVSNEIKTWMFREENEILYLVITLLIVLITGIVILQINFYVSIVLIVLGFILIKLQQAQLIGNALELNEYQFPEIYEVFKEYKIKLGLTKVNLYIRQDPSPNAFTIGFLNASIILSSALVENFSKEELNFTIAHELGHVKAGHNTLLTLISPLGNGFIGASTIFSFWQRKAEYTSDKCGLTLTRKIEPAIYSLLKLTVGLHLTDKVHLGIYKDQLINSETNMVKVSEFLFDHPLTTNRIRKLVNYWKDNFVRK